MHSGPSYLKPYLITHNSKRAGICEVGEFVPIVIGIRLPILNNSNDWFRPSY